MAKLLKRYACPCCKNRTLGGRGTEYICPVCMWQDDESANHGLSLAQARDNYERIGAVDPGQLMHARPPNKREATGRVRSGLQD